MTQHRRGILFIISSPSGAGKTTLTRALLATDATISLSISVTTRPMRRGERDGHDYHFVSETRFQGMIAAGAFLEWAHVFDHRYGTPRAMVEEQLASGEDMLFDVDWQGAQHLRQEIGEDVVSLYILPPSAEELRNRLIKRQTDSPAVITARMAKAPDEISHWNSYDYILVNDILEDCVTNIQAIVTAERTKRASKIVLSHYTNDLIRLLKESERKD